MNKNNLPSPELLRKLLRYDPDTGNLYWRKRSADMFCAARNQSRQCNTWNSRYAGRKAFTAISRCYYVGAVLNRTCKAHRVAWAIYYGEYPTKNIDHIDGNGTNNAIKNMRDVSQADNCKNSKISSNNKSGITGVCWDKSRSSWTAYIKVDGKKIHLGNFTELNDAANARKIEENKHGFHENHGR